MSVDSLLQALATILAPVAGIIGLLSRRRRLRGEIRENIALLHEAEKDQAIREHTPALNWLRGKITIDIAKLTGQPIGTPRKPVPKGSLTFSATISIASGAWTYYIVRDGFDWYAVFPGTLAALMAIAVFGMVSDRELPEQANKELPQGAIPIRNDSVTGQLASALALKESEGSGDRFSDSGPIGMAFSFFNAMREGRAVEAFALADRNWRLCRVQAWLWNNREQFDTDTNGLEQLAESLLARQQPPAIWKSFMELEAHQFNEALGSIDADSLGAASRQRRIAKDYELVILAPTGATGGYYVTSATAVPDAITFVMHRVDGRWLLASHCSTAPPTPGWPPAWWMVNDPAVDTLPDSRNSI